MEEVSVSVSVSVPGKVVSGNNGTHFNPTLGETENQKSLKGKMCAKELRPPS
jgi:hypothetical protein